MSNDHPSVITGEHGPASKGLIDWLKTIFGKAFTVSRGYSAGHDGIDLPAKEGTPVYALVSGTVSYAKDARKQADSGLSGWAKYGGKVVNIDIGNQVTTQYAHLSDFIVREGQFIRAGQLIGYVGRTGGSPDSPTAQFSGPHLHFGLWDRRSNRMINPQNFFENLGDTEGSGSMLGAWNDKIQFEVGHILTSADIDSIMKTLKDEGYFEGDSLLGGSETKTREILTSHIGQPWTKNLQSTIQQEFSSAAVSAGDPIAAVGAQIVDTFTWIGFILIGLVLIAGGIYLLGTTRSAKEE